MLSPPAKGIHRPYSISSKGAKSMDVTVKRGDVFFADLSPVVGSEQGGNRPVPLFKTTVGNHYGPTVIVAAVPPNPKPKMPTHVGFARQTRRG